MKWKRDKKGSKFYMLLVITGQDLGEVCRRLE